jgi:hypothetical protein
MFQPLLAEHKTNWSGNWRSAERLNCNLHHDGNFRQWSCLHSYNMEKIPQHALVGLIAQMLAVLDSRRSFLIPVVKSSIAYHPWQHYLRMTIDPDWQRLVDAELGILDSGGILARLLEVRIHESAKRVWVSYNQDMEDNSLGSFWCVVGL